jgi:hypothetical protein
MEKIKAEIDERSTGTHQRWTVGEVGYAVSGALYIPKNTELPYEVTIVFPKKGAKDDLSYS